MPFRRIPLAILVCYAAITAPAAPANLTVEVTVFDQAKQPVPGVEVRFQSIQNIVSSAITDANGQAHFTQLEPGHYEIAATKQGFEPIEKSEIDLPQAGALSLELTLAPSMVRRESIEVHGTVAPVDQGSSPPTELPAQIAKELPSRPATVADTLPLIPVVARSPGRALQISGSA